MGSAGQFSESERDFMRRALALAARGQGRVEPNPMVGAVVAKGDRIVGEGYHRRFGGPHAEVHALKGAGAKGRGATLYVSLEPCCHWGKTPPCTEAILAAGVRRVVCAMKDPFRQVAGGGIQLLRRAGVKVDVGLLEEEATDLNRPFLMRVMQGRPFFIAKWAQSLDGAVATSAGESQWISSEQSREMVHRLRGRVDAVLTGVGSVLADNPRLTARPAKTSAVKRIAMRVVLDSDCRTPPQSWLATSAREIPVVLFHRRTPSAAGKKRARVLMECGVDLVGINQQDGQLALQEVAAELFRRGMTNVLLECGPRLMTSFQRAALIDQYHVFVAPMLIPGAASQRPLGGVGIAALQDAPRLQIDSQKMLGSDYYMIARPAAG